MNKKNYKSETRGLLNFGVHFAFSVILQQSRVALDGLFLFFETFIYWLGSFYGERHG